VGHARTANEHPPDLVLAARKSWTGAAFQEHRTGAACAETLRCLIECRAPLDLIAVASRFPLDEMVHVELCARMAMELGGGTEILPRPGRDDPARQRADLSPLLRCRRARRLQLLRGRGALHPACIRGTWQASVHPLPRAILGRIVKDEAAHGDLRLHLPRLGGADLLSDADRVHLTRAARIRPSSAIHGLWADIKRRAPARPRQHACTRSGGCRPTRTSRSRGARCGTR
jgi:hypothetical protein